MYEKIVMKPSIKDTILELRVGTKTFFRVPQFKISSVRNTVSDLKKECPDRTYECTEKGIPDGIEVSRIN